MEKEIEKILEIEFELKYSEIYDCLRIRDFGQAQILGKNFIAWYCEELKNTEKELYDKLRFCEAWLNFLKGFDFQQAKETFRFMPRYISPAPTTIDKIDEDLLWLKNFLSMMSEAVVSEAKIEEIFDSAFKMERNDDEDDAMSLLKRSLRSNEHTICATVSRYQDFLEQLQELEKFADGGPDIDPSRFEQWWCCPRLITTRNADVCFLRNGRTYGLETGILIDYETKDGEIFVKIKTDKEEILERKLLKGDFIMERKQYDFLNKNPSFSETYLEYALANFDDSNKLLIVLAV